MPWHPHSAAERTEDNYFEAHVPVTIDVGQEGDLYDLIKMHPGSHLSKNSLKKFKDGSVVMMVTMRHNDCDLDKFNTRLNGLKESLDEYGFDYGSKDMVEWAIYDNNITHDVAWIED